MPLILNTNEKKNFIETRMAGKEQPGERVEGEEGGRGGQIT